MTHEIVTVGDPLLSSGLRSIGSRRHSTSSLSQQQSKLRMISPLRAGNTYSRHSVSLVSSVGSSSEHELSVKSTDHFVGSVNASAPSASVQSCSTSSGSQKTVATSGSKTHQLDAPQPVEGKHPSSSDLIAKGAPSKGEKMKTLTSKDPDFSAHSFTSGANSKTQSMSSLPSTEMAVKIGMFQECSGSFSSKEAMSFPPLHPRGLRKDRDQHVEPVQPEKTAVVEEGDAKTLKPAGVSSRSPAASDQVVAAPRDRRQKGKKSLKDNFKEKHSLKPLADPTQVLGSDEGNLKPEFGNQGLATEQISQRLCNNLPAEKAGEKSPPSQGPSKGSAGQVEAALKEPQAPRKRTVKVTLTPLKMESENQSKNAQQESDAEPQSAGAELATLAEPPSTSDSLEGNPEVQGAPNEAPAPESQNNAYENLPVQDNNLMLQDGSKAQEEGSYKRRYPRRSARARSNMFFGLTPLYGVRSYGEEDIPFYSNSTGKKRGKRSAEGQVDGADDLSTSDEDDLYYYNFTRTVVSSSAEERLAAHSLFREEEQCDIPKISQLDGVDDGTESDTSVTATTRKVSQVTKRSGKENGTDNLKLDRSEEAGEKVQVSKSSAVHKADPKMENCHPVSRVKAPGQDSLEAQLSSLETGRRAHASTPSDKNLLDTFNTELLKSDSDNNNSDDCGNILPSDIMDFVLKNTPSMQALGESPESSSSELLTLGEGLGLDSNRGKDMGLFEVFSQQLPTAEPVDSSVSSSISAEEQFELPLELPSDLSVLTTRSPTVPSQNHNRLAVISESSLSSSGERSMLALPSSESGEKRVTVTEKSASGEGDTALLSPGVDPSPEGHMTPDHFIQGHMDAEHIASPPCGPVEQGHGSNQDLTRNSGTPGLQVPVSPTVPLQSQKYVSNSTDSAGPSQISNAAVQTTPPHLKPAAEKLLVVNQNMQPLYVLQTLPNGMTQKIQLTPSVSSAQSVMETSASVLGPMGSGLTLTTGLNPSLPSSQSLFPPTSKGLLPMSHHQHIHPFPGTAQTGFPPNISSPSPGLLIGVQPPPEPQLLVSEASPRTDLGSTTSAPTTALGKKRPISRLQSRKNKKLAPSGTPSAIATPDIVSNMTLINFAPSQISNHPLDLGTIANSTSHRTVPNIIKRSKSGVMYFEQTSLLPQGGTTAAVGTSPSVIGPEGSHLPAGPVSGLASSSSVLNVVSMPATAVPTTGGSVPSHVLGQSSVTLTSPGLLGDLGSISNLLIKASQQSLGLQEQHMTLPPSSGMFSQLGASQTPSTAAMTAASSICVLPSAQTMGMTAAPSSADPEGSYQLQHMTQLLASKAGVASSQLDLGAASATAQLSSFPQLVDAPSNSGLDPTKASSSAIHGSSASPGGSPSAGQQSASSAGLGPAKTKPKVKRIQPLLDKGTGKKHKTSHVWSGSSEAHASDRGALAVPQVSAAG